MKNNLNKNITSMFEECGLSFCGKDRTYGFDLPKKIDLIPLSGILYDECNEDTKLKLIQEFIWKKNYMHIINWKIFLPNLNINKLEEDIFEVFFETVEIHYIDKTLKFNFYRTYNFDSIIKNNDFLGRLSKEFQLKRIFLQKDSLLLEVKKGTAKLMVEKMKEMGIAKKINRSLPRLIMENIDSNNLDRI